MPNTVLVIGENRGECVRPHVASVRRISGSSVLVKAAPCNYHQPNASTNCANASTWTKVRSEGPFAASKIVGRDDMKRVKMVTFTVRMDTGKAYVGRN